MPFKVSRLSATKRQLNAGGRYANFNGEPDEILGDLLLIQ